MLVYLTLHWTNAWPVRFLIEILKVFKNHCNGPSNYSFCDLCKNLCIYLTKPKLLTANHNFRDLRDWTVRDWIVRRIEQRARLWRGHGSSWWQGVTVELRGLTWSCYMCRSTLGKKCLNIRCHISLGHDSNKSHHSQDQYLMTSGYLSSSLEIVYINRTRSSTIIHKLTAPLARHDIAMGKHTLLWMSFQSSSAWKFTHASWSSLWPQSNGMKEDILKAINCYRAKQIMKHGAG